MIFNGYSKFFKFYILIPAILLVAFLSFNKSYQHALPYYISASLDYSYGDLPKYNQNEVDKFNQHDSGIYSLEKGFYSFKDAPQSHTNKEVVDRFGYAFSHGFIIYIKLCRFIFGNLFGDLNSIILMNLLIHIISFYLVLSKFADKYSKFLFYLLFAINPFILHLATFPYHYYPITLISAILIFIGSLNHNQRFCGIIISGILSNLRITIIPAIIYSSLKLFKDSKILFFLAFSFLLFLYFYIKNFTYGYHEPYYTAIIGLGAYENINKIEMNDAFILNLIEKYRYEYGYFFMNIWYADEMTLMKDIFIYYIKSDIFGWFSTIVKNIFILFGGGYLIGQTTYNTLAASLGFLHIIILVYMKNYDLMFMIFLSAIGVVLFFPPIPAYVASSYIFLAYSGTCIIDMFINKFKK